MPPPERLQDQSIVRARQVEAGGKTSRRYLAETMLDVRPVGKVSAFWLYSIRVETGFSGDKVEFVIPDHASGAAVLKARYEDHCRC